VRAAILEDAKVTLLAAGPISLEGQRMGEGPAGGVRLELVERTSPTGWRAVRTGGVACAAGDRLRFGDQSNRVCFLGTLDATVAGVEADGSLSLEFEFYGAALDEMLSALSEG
jgi:S-adenosylmethionine:tRNA ribosyltransferase-isomerase